MAGEVSVCKTLNINICQSTLADDLQSAYVLLKTPVKFSISRKYASSGLLLKIIMYLIARTHLNLHLLVQICAISCQNEVIWRCENDMIYGKLFYFLLA